MNSRLVDLTHPVRSAALELRVRWRLRGGLDRALPYGDIVPLTLSSAFAHSRSSKEILRLARRCVISGARTALDHRDLERGGCTHEVIHTGPLLDLKRRGVGAVVCALHLGPYYFITLELGKLGLDVKVMTADWVQARRLEAWAPIIRRLPGHIEPLPAQGPRSLIRAMRALKQGSVAMVYMDGQTGVGGPGGGRHHSVDMELLGLPVRIRVGPAYLAQRARVPVIMAAARRGAFGRRVVEFSDPLPTPKGDGPEEREAMLRAMVAWFEERIRRDLDQWNGWFYPVFTWGRSGEAPTATPQEIARERERVGALLSDDRTRAVLRADPARATAFEFEGFRALVHGPTRRILEATPLAYDLMAAARRGVRMNRLPPLFPVERSVLVDEVARMVLADLAVIEECSRV